MKGAIVGVVTASAVLTLSGSAITPTYYPPQPAYYDAPPVVYAPVPYYRPYAYYGYGYYGGGHRYSHPTGRVAGASANRSSTYREEKALWGRLRACVGAGLPMHSQCM